MVSDGDTRADARLQGEAPLGRWLTIDRDDAYVHVFVGTHGLVTRGPDPLLGRHYRHLVGSLDEGRITIHPKGQKPVAHDAHPQYRQVRVADLSHRPSEEAPSALEEALANAPIAPWVRALRRDLLTQTRSLLRRGETDLPIAVTGSVAPATIAATRRQAALLPPLYRTLWRAAGYQCNLVGRHGAGLPEVAEREQRQGTPGIFVPTLNQAYVFVQHTPTEYDVRMAFLEEMAHGLDVLIGVLHGHEGQRPGRLPLETVARSNQPDFVALWSKNRNKVTIDRYYRRSAGELFAWTLTDYLYGLGILERDHPHLFRFMMGMEREVAAYVGA